MHDILKQDSAEEEDIYWTQIHDNHGNSTPAVTSATDDTDIAIPLVPFVCPGHSRIMSKRLIGILVIGRNCFTAGYPRHSSKRCYKIWTAVIHNSLNRASNRPTGAVLRDFMSLCKGPISDAR